MTHNDRIKHFQKIVRDFYKKNKRDFPWRRTTDSYKILVSEIMLQQTQAGRVVDYYSKWIMRFPDFLTLAKASFGEIYPYWQGLGYNRRALALQKLAKEVTEKYGGKLPVDVGRLRDLPGIGLYTARAVVIFSFNAPITCIETNIRRVFIHHFFAGKENVTDQEILKIAEAALDKENSREWHWALMDYGAYLKSQIPNPNRRAKNYAVQSKFEGSLRQIRGKILRMLEKKPKNFLRLAKEIKREKGNIKTVLESMQKEGFIGYNKKKKIFYLN